MDYKELDSLVAGALSLEQQAELLRVAKVLWGSLNCCEKMAQNLAEHGHEGDCPEDGGDAVYRIAMDLDAHIAGTFIEVCGGDGFEPVSECPGCTRVLGPGEQVYQCNLCDGECCTACSLSGPHHEVLCDNCTEGAAE